MLHLRVVATVLATMVSVAASASAQAGPGVGESPYMVGFMGRLDAGDSSVTITNTGANGAGLGSGTSASVTGAICANVYAYNPTEEVVSCCSCPVTPNGLVSLSGRLDLINNPLTPATPRDIVIKIVATQPVGGSCTNSALLAGTPTLVNGLLVNGTTTHVDNSVLPIIIWRSDIWYPWVVLSAAEQARLAYGCGVVANVGSGFGVCNSCRLGALGATAK